MPKESKKLKGSIMQEKIVEIILYLITGLKENSPIEETVIEELLQKGYTQTEISTAFSWLYDKVKIGETVLYGKQNISGRSHRVFHEAEKLIFSPEAQGYLIQCYELCLIDELQMEYIIDRAIFSGLGKVGIEEVKSLVLFTLFDIDDSDNLGSRVMINPKDTIN
jgi:uncharacterized protein Smg (DUF494 family)